MILETFSNPNDSVWCRKAGRSPGTQRVAPHLPWVCQDPSTFPPNGKCAFGVKNPNKTHEKKISSCDAICVCSMAQRGQAVPRLLSTYARELKEVARAFLLIFSPWERNVLFLLGTTYLLGISLFRSFDFFSNCVSLASTACLGYFLSHWSPSC